MDTITHRYDRPSDAQVRAAEALVSRFAALWRRPDPETFRALMHEDTRNLVPPMTEPADREGVVRHFSEVVRRFPGIRVDVLRWALAGETAMIEWRASATVAGQPLEWTGVDVMRLRGDRMFEAQVYWDTRAVAERAAAAMQATAAG
ncbi:MAG TPA: nuclear transport factor 2 family protein [Burkholderiaceae bacterium]